MTISTLLLLSSGQEWQFHTATEQPVVNNGNCTWISSSQEWLFHIATDILWSLRMAISHCY